MDKSGMSVAFNLIFAFFILRILYIVVFALSHFRNFAFYNILAEASAQ